MGGWFSRGREGSLGAARQICQPPDRRLIISLGRKR